MKADLARIRELRERLSVGLAEAKSALESCDGDVDRAASQLRAAGVAQLCERTGASPDLAGRVYDEVRGDAERAAVRLGYLVSTGGGPSALRRVLDSGAPTEAVARDLHQLIGGFEGDGSVRDAVYLVVDLCVQTAADGLTGFLETLGVEDLPLVVDAAERIGAAPLAAAVREVAGLMRGARGAAPPPGLAALEESIQRARTDSLERTVAFAQEQWML